MKIVSNKTKPAASDRRFAGPVFAALLATAATLATLAPQRGGPGITCDELYHVLAGKRLVMAFGQQGLSFFAPENIARNFPWAPEGPPVHPPLGNWILGATHRLFDPAPDDPAVVSLVAARFAPAVAFGVLVLLVGLWVASRDGALAGTISALAAAIVPRMFGHAHLAALDMITALTFIAALLAAIEADRRGGRWWQFALAGAVWGLAMLTRLHGVLLLPPVVVWLGLFPGERKRNGGPGPVGQVRRLNVERLRCAAVWAGAGVATLFAGWPWLWLAPLAHLAQFLGTGVHRQAIHVFYFGRVWADHEAPWHYAPVMFLVTVPLGLLLLGIAGLWAKQRRAALGGGYGLVLGTMVWVLAVFALPGAPVYDGVRLFLMVFPQWAMFVGPGARWVVEHPRWKSVSLGPRRAALGLFLAAQAIGLVVYHPFQLSHYSLLVGGLWGAEKLGFEVTYWGDAVTEPLLAEAARLAPHEIIVLGPSLAPFQAPAVAMSSPAIVQGACQLVGWEQSWTEPPPNCRYGIFYQRKADLTQVPRRFLSGEVLKETRKQGVWLARLVRLPPLLPDKASGVPIQADRAVRPAPLDGTLPHTYNGGETAPF